MIDGFSRRPAWVRWIPAAVLGAVIVVAVLFSLIAAPRLTADPGPGQTDEVTDLNWSVFTEEGLAYIEATRTPRIDLSSPPVDALALGLPADGSLTVGPHVTDLDYRLVLIATDSDGNAVQPNGALYTTPQFTVSTREGRVQAVRVEERGAFDFRETYLLMAERSADLGYTAPPSARLAEAVTEARESGEPAVVRSNRGLSTGMGVTAEATCFGAGFCQVSFLVTPAVG